jgi:hypothetical protein
MLPVEMEEEDAATADVALAVDTASSVVPAVAIATTYHY